MGTDGFTRTGMTRPPSMPISAFSCRLFFFTQSSEKIWIQVRRNEVIKGISGFTLATLRQARHSSKTLNSKSRDGGRRTGLTLPRWTSRTLEAQWARLSPPPASYRECSCKLHHFLPTTRPSRTNKFVWVYYPGVICFISSIFTGLVYFSRYLYNCLVLLTGFAAFPLTSSSPQFIFYYYISRHRCYRTANAPQ